MEYTEECGVTVAELISAKVLHSCSPEVGITKEPRDSRTWSI